MRQRKPSIRTCTGCGASSDKRTVVRFVRTPDGTVEFDPTGKANGRGAYVCASMGCYDDSIRRRRLSSALRVTMTEDDTDRLRAELERHLSDHGALVNGDGEPS